MEQTVEMKEILKKLLIRKMKLKKQYDELLNAYLKTFGKSILELYFSQIEYLKLKKTIDIFQIKIARNEAIDLEEIDAKVMESMLYFSHDYLKIMNETDLALYQRGTSIENKTACQNIFEKIIESIHPELHPEHKGIRRFEQLYEQAVVAYLDNALDELQDLNDIINSVLRSYSTSEIVFKTYDWNGLIKKTKSEIDNIKNTDVYTFRFILEDPEMISSINNQLLSFNKMFKSYNRDLKKQKEELYKEHNSLSLNLLN